MNQVRVISFDLDDTLWAIWPVIDRAEALLHDHLCTHFPRITEHHDRTDLRRLRNALNEERPDIAHDLTELRRVSFESLLEQYDYDAKASYDLVARFLELRHDVTLYPDVVPALEILSDKFTLIAVSNGNADVSRLEIGKFFSGQISARTAGVKKPDPKIFQKACEIVNAKSFEVLHVGDHPLEDVLGSQDAGLPAVWMNRGGDQWPHDRQTHLEVTDLTELVKLLNQAR